MLLLHNQFIKFTFCISKLIYLPDTIWIDKNLVAWRRCTPWSIHADPTRRAGSQTTQRMLMCAVELRIGAPGGLEVGEHAAID